MNEKFKELAKQSGFTVWECKHGDSSVLLETENESLLVQPELEQFYMQLIKEVIGIIDGELDMYVNDYDDVVVRRDDAISAIKKRFGVE
jgi:hypothetical protein